MINAQNFKKLLNDFFRVYHPRQVKKVDAIAQEFMGKEVEVLKHLCIRYKVSFTNVPGLEEALLQKNEVKNQVIEEKTEDEETSVIEKNNEEEN